MNVGGTVPNYKYVLESKLLTSQAEYSLFCVVFFLAGVLPSDGVLDDEV